MKGMNMATYVPTVDFKEQTPAIQIEEVRSTALYKKAWMDNDSGEPCEYCQNTTAWD